MADYTPPGDWPAAKAMGRIDAYLKRNTIDEIEYTVRAIDNLVINQLTLDADRAGIRYSGIRALGFGLDVETVIQYPDEDYRLVRDLAEEVWRRPKSIFFRLVLQERFRLVGLRDDLLESADENNDEHILLFNHATMDIHSLRAHLVTFDRAFYEEHEMEIFRPWMKYARDANVLHRIPRRR